MYSELTTIAQVRAIDPRQNNRFFDPQRLARQGIEIEGELHAGKLFVTSSPHGDGRRYIVHAVQPSGAIVALRRFEVLTSYEQAQQLIRDLIAIGY